MLGVKGDEFAWVMQLFFQLFVRRLVVKDFNEPNLHFILEHEVTSVTSMEIGFWCGHFISLDGLRLFRRWPFIVPFF